LAMLKEKQGLGYEVFSRLLLAESNLQKLIEKFFEGEEASPTLEKIPFSQRYRQLLNLADIEASALHNEYIGTEHLLLAAIREEDSITHRYFAIADYGIMDVRFIVMELQAEKKTSFYQQENENLMDILFRTCFSDSSSILEEKTSPKKKAAPLEDKSKANVKQSILSEYSRDLTKLALENKLDPVVGRNKEIHRVIQILSRRTKNNPVLTGEPGVGKTAIVEGLAQRIASGNVPSDLLKKKLLSLDLAAVVAGTKYRGEFEERMKNILSELQSNKNIILFIDELHSIIGAGGNEGTMDASNIMKPALSRGEIQIIGATTTKEYTKHIERDMALERRFQVVKVEEPDIKDAKSILEGIKEKYEKYHNVIYAEDVIETIVRLSKRYLPEKVLPDKAIDILDEAGASKKIQEDEQPSELAELEFIKSELEKDKQLLIDNQNYEKAAAIRAKVIELRKKLDAYTEMWENNKITNERIVSSSDIERIISEMTGIPVEQMTSSETERIINMEKELHKLVIGQNEAVKTISDSIRRSRAGISSPKHPLGSFIFLGPTGVGKTQLAKALAKYLFGSDDALIRIDMSDYMEKHTASRLVGAPPGYVGYEEGGLLTEKVRRHPYSVILLDEIEKAHPDIFNLLLQLLEEGELSDNLGHTVNFRNTVIIMTSNAGARQITNEGRVGFGKSEGLLAYSEIKSGAMNELKKLLSPELINRIDDIIVFNALDKKEVAKILDIQLAELSERLAEKKLKIEITNKAKDYLITNGYNPAMGARPLRRLIQKEVENPLAMELLENNGKLYNTVAISISKDHLNIKLQNTEEIAEKEKVSVTSIRS